ncbi:MAG: hypothetical protein NT136_03940 [Candidatus Moranbacteria bacterium]|nr:hypothetical protein [Candidatus Moranbacteria bacterium]
MKQLEFEGELKWISPNKIIKEGGYNVDNEVASFFIGFGVIFNDLKDLILFEQLLINNYRKPKEKKASVHSGSYNGIIVHINKLIASTIHEFFKFLNKNKKILGTREFNEILNKLPAEEKIIWNGLVAASQGNLLKALNFLKTIVRIRSNIAFHYDHSGKILKRGYKSRFFGEYKDDSNKCAYYSIGDKIELTRFFFADAVVEESLFIEAGKEEKKKFIEDMSLIKYQAQLRETVNVVTKIIKLLLKNFLQSRRNRP